MRRGERTRMADKTIGGEGIRQDWRIDEKNNNKQPKNNSNKRKSNKRQQENGNI